MQGLLICITICHDIIDHHKTRIVKVTKKVFSMTSDNNGRRIIDEIFMNVLKEGTSYPQELPTMLGVEGFRV